MEEQKNNNDCFICFNAFEGKVSMCNNNHFICIPCYNRHIQTSNKCPMCRKEHIYLFKNVNISILLQNSLVEFNLLTQNLEELSELLQQTRQQITSLISLKNQIKHQRNIELARLQHEQYMNSLIQQASRSTENLSEQELEQVQHARYQIKVEMLKTNIQDTNYFNKYSVIYPSSMRGYNYELFTDLCGIKQRFLAAIKKALRNNYRINFERIQAVHPHYNRQIMNINILTKYITFEKI